MADEATMTTAPSTNPASAPAAAAAVFTPPSMGTHVPPGSPVTINVAAPVAPTSPSATPQTSSPASTPLDLSQQSVTLPLSQINSFLAMQSRLADIEAEQRNREQAGQQEQARILAQKGEVENALKLLRENSEKQVQDERARFTQVEERAKRYALDGELSRALGACNLVPGGAEQLTQLWRNQFLVDSQGDSFAVRTPAFQSVGDFVHQQLARPEYAHFVRAQNPGGGTGGVQPSQQTAPSGPMTPTEQPQPKNMGEAVILHMQQLQKSHGDPKSNMALPIGLKAVR